jgi:hypothetical protein
MLCQSPHPQKFLKGHSGFWAENVLEGSCCRSVKLLKLLFIFNFWCNWGLTAGLGTWKVLYPLSYTFSPFCSGYFGGRVLQTIGLGLPQTSILLISAF